MTKKSTMTLQTPGAFSPTQPKKTRKSWKTFFILVIGLFSLYFIIIPDNKYTMTPSEWKAFIQAHPYQAPTATDVRSPCPFLNTMANHGILPRSGKNITFEEFHKVMRMVGTTSVGTRAFLYFAFYVYNEIDPLQPMRYDLRLAPHLDLDHIGIHNIIEHDVSLSRPDAFHQPDFSIPSLEQVQSLASTANATTSMVGIKELSDFRRKRWIESIQTNPYHHFGFGLQINAGVECALLLNFLGRDHQISAAHLESFLLKETIPDDWYGMEKTLSPWTITKRVTDCITSVRNNNF
ncbi:Chloroperoxidase [Halteromyces radiatus]|uniref:Chloroperoxidase n=1 Tax=Halteromyces radiatus TaxID=101107 RepID=UPI00221EC068|nr:Chloroperoxidase [Halteromyces radiatus]KAI8084803.1 Chloroperoxidase [Halteromyces radiatus]